MKQRFAPFLVLLEARYAPLLFAVAPQAYAVYLWLWRGSDQTNASFWFAIAGALGYELVYVGAIAWAEEDRASFWTWATATVALIFSIVVAFYVYSAQGTWAWLHAGFPLVAFCYTLNMYSKRATHTPAQASQETPGATETSKTTQDTTLTQSASSALPVASGQATGDPFLDTLLALPNEAEQPLYTCKHCGSALASKQASGNAARFGCSNLACPGRANRKAKALPR